jgi:hypothetical protein
LESQPLPPLPSPPSDLERRSRPARRRATLAPRRREWTSSPSPSPPATPPRFVLPIRHPNLPTTAGHGACRSDAAPAPRPPPCRTSSATPGSLQVGAPGCPAGRLVAWSLEAGAPCCLHGGRHPLDPAPSEGLFKIVVYIVHDFGHIIDY